MTKLVVDSGVVLRLAAEDRTVGDAVLRCRAWEIADELGWTETAEYVALTQLQGDAFVTLDERVARDVSRLVEVVGFEALA